MFLTFSRSIETYTSSNSRKSHSQLNSPLKFWDEKLTGNEAFFVSAISTDVILKHILLSKCIFKLLLLPSEHKDEYKINKSSYHFRIKLLLEWQRTHV